MPIYVYECEICGRRFEKLTTSTKDQEAPSCTDPECSGSTKRVPARTSFVLKGGGWASDGYSS